MRSFISIGLKADVRWWCLRQLYFGLVVRARNRAGRRVVLGYQDRGWYCVIMDCRYSRSMCV